MMSLGEYTFIQNPSSGPVITEKRRANAIKTLGGVGFFSWGAFIEGQEITIKWKVMPTAQYDQFITFLTADAELVWDPESGSTYNVEIRNLSGDYFMSVSGTYRINVELTLTIISKVV